METSKRTLVDLMHRDRRVFLFIANDSLWDSFAAQAESESFRWSDGRLVSNVTPTNIVAVNDNMTFNYVNFVGHLRFLIDHENLLRIDYEKYINGADDVYYSPSRP